jgi:multidrug efflux pump
MNLSALFIGRPVATTLLTAGICLAGLLAFAKLAVSPLPQIDFPTISVQAMLPGANPETVASSVASPLERHLGQIAGVAEMTSKSSIGQTSITLQFDIDRDIDGAARDVEAAINAARADLPTSLRSNPTYRKVNPADAPILILALTSDTSSPGQIYDAASDVLAQRIAQLEGVGQVVMGGSSLPAVRIELDPHALFKYGIGLEDVRAAIAAANANSPKGVIEEGDKRFQIYTNDQAPHAEDYAPLVIAYRNGAAVHLSDVAEVLDSVEDLRMGGLANGKPAVVIRVFRLPGANIIRAVDAVKAELPRLEASIPRGIDITLAFDRSNTIRASLHDAEWTLVIAVLLVTLIAFAFLRDFRATLVPAIVVPTSIIGTFGAMYLLGYSLNHLSLMALTIATGFVVDDAIVVMENIERHIEAGRDRVSAALIGAREVGFTVVSISVSLIAVFIPILLMGGVLGRLFHEFAVTLSVAIVVSLVLSLTTTPMLCAYVLSPPRSGRPGSLGRCDPFGAVRRAYERSLRAALRHERLVLVVFIAVVGLNAYLYAIVPKGFFPQQDTGRIMGGIQADQNSSFQAMVAKLTRFQAIIQADPAVHNVTGYTGALAGETNTARIFTQLKPWGERTDGVETVIARLRKKASEVPGARLFLQSGQEFRVGGRASDAQFQFTLQGDTTEELAAHVPRLVTALQKSPLVADVNSDQQPSGLQTKLVIDRDTASRLGVTPSQIDNTLYDAFGQRQVSIIYKPNNQYRVVMEVAPRYAQDPEMLKEIYVGSSGATPSGTASSNLPGGTVSRAVAASGAEVAVDATSDAARNARTNALAVSGKGSASTGAAVSTRQERSVPLSAIARFEQGNTPLAVNHQGPFVAATVSFNLLQGVSLGDAAREVKAKMLELGIPASIRAGLAGTAQAFESYLANQPFLILAAIVSVYIVLGVLYESYIHPLTILSTLPSAGVGAILALLAFGAEFSVIAMIGVILLIGIVKKNAIMMIDFALDAQRTEGLAPREAITRACVLRFRPIVMTTFAAIFGAIPLVLTFGDGAELRRPLGIAIVGGLVVSQMLTLYTTPVLYLQLDRLRSPAWRRRGRWFPAPARALPGRGSRPDTGS